MSATNKEFGEPIESWKGSGKFDSKGREIGFIVGFNDNGEDFRAWVQAGRRTAHDFHDFGVRQRSKGFKSQEEAARWAWRTANERITALA